MRLGVLAMMGRPPAAAGGLSASFLQQTHDAADLTTYTFSSQSFGAAAADRSIVLAVMVRALNTTALTVTSVTIGGVSATIDVQITETSSHAALAGIARAAVPSGTSGDVVVEMSREVLKCTIGVWRITGDLAVTSVASDGGSGTLRPGTMTTADGGYLAACGASPQASGGSAAVWTGGLSKLWDEEADAFWRHTGAGAATTGASPYVSVENLDHVEGVAAAVAYEPGGA